MVAIASFKIERFPTITILLLLSMAFAFGKDNPYLYANASVMESSVSESSVGRRLVICCVNEATNECHTRSRCNDSDAACASNKCQSTVETYSWKNTSPPPPTNPPTAQPTNPQTPSPTKAPVIATPAPTKSPVAASCGLCVEDNSISCSTNADCPLVPSEGTCTSPGGAETDGSPCLSNDDCLPNTGKQFSRGKCNNVGTVNSECDPNLCPPTNAPTKSPVSPPTDTPTTQPTSNPTSSSTSQPPTAEPTSNPTLAPTPQPTNTSPAPTSNPTSFPTAQPTANPTFPTYVPTSAPSAPPTSKIPTAQPTANPTSPPTPTTAIETISCPSSETPLVLTSGTKQIARSSTTSFCGIFIKLESEYLVPYARSYSANDWEPSPGPKAAPASGIECNDAACTVELPPLTSGSYVIMTKPTRAHSNREKIARFLEATTFGTKMEEINALDTGNFGATERAAAVRAQIDLPKSSHREYFRRRANPKWDATTVNARSDHPCDPNSRWRNYAYIKHDVYDTITEENIYTTFVKAPEEAGKTYSIYQAENQGGVTHGNGVNMNATTGNGGYAGDGYYDFAGLGDFLAFNISVPNNTVVPISFRYAMGSSSYNGNRPCVLSVNNVTVRDVYNFFYSGSWGSWIYSEMVNISLKAGFNTIKLLIRDQNNGPNIDFLRVGKPAALILKTRGWIRAVAKNGVGTVDDFGFDFTNQTVYFPSYPNAKEGDLYRYPYGRLRVNVTGVSRYLDIGNPELDFDGFEDHLPLHHFILDNGEIFEETSSDIADYPMVRNQEYVLRSGLDRAKYPICDSIASNEEYSAPVFAKTPSGKWIQWTPTIDLRQNGPPMNADPGEMTSFTLLDGGGEAFIQTGEKLKCANVARTFENEDTCTYTTLSTACSPTRVLGELNIKMNETSISTFFNVGGLYVYAIKGIVMENLDEHACLDTKSRWAIQSNATCSLPTSLHTNTSTALLTAILGSTDTNPYIKDVNGPLVCADTDITVDKLGIQIQVGSDCYTHVHKDYLNVYDFTGWVSNHPGGEYNIQKWASGWNGTEGWYLVFPYNGDAARKIPKHPMSRWDNNKGPPNIVYVAKFGNSIAYRDLPNSMKTDSTAKAFGAATESIEGAGTIVCGSHGEVANDKSLREVFDFRSNEKLVTSVSTMDNQRAVVWYEQAMWAPDQFRQRQAWALSQLFTIVPKNIDVFAYTETFTKYYDHFVKHAFGNFRDIMKLVSYSPLTAEHLTYVGSKSHSYNYRKEDKRDSRPDENYSRESMQLFTIGLWQLNEDGTLVIDSLTGKPIPTYTNENIESFARVWTGFERRAVRGNYEESRSGTTANRLDPMQIIAAYRDPFPKPNLAGGFLGDRYLRCVDLPSQSFLRKGATYTLRGGSPLSEHRTDPSYYVRDGVERFVLDTSSALYQLLHNNGQYKLTVELQDDLPCTSTECEVDTVRMVKVDDVYFEFKERPCVQMAFYNGGKQIRAKENLDLGSMCANPNLAHASEACCREERYQEVRSATKETGVTYFYEGERTTYNTARERCLNAGKDLCMFEYTTVVPINDWWKKGYSWTNKDCEIMVKINQEGYVAVVHNADNSYKNQIDRYGIPAEVDEDDSLNWFKVHWQDGYFPGSSPENSCASNKCKSKPDGLCVCRTTVSESVVFDSVENINSVDVMSQLFLGALGPDSGSTPTTGNGFIAHIVNGNVDASTVFEVQDKGRTFYLKNIVSEVNLFGWEGQVVPKIYEAEDAAVRLNATISNTTSSASNGRFIDFDLTDEAYVQWDVIVSDAGEYQMTFRYALDTHTRQMEVHVNGVEVKWPPPNANPIINLNYIGGDPQTNAGFTFLTRCQGDCDIDEHCAPGLFCLQVNKGGSAFPGCNTTSGSDFCVDKNDFDKILFHGTGGWSDDWKHTDAKIVSLKAGVNTIKLKVPFGNDNAPNIDYMKIEGLPSTTTTNPSKFRNPPHFVALIAEENTYTEQNVIDAEYEVDALIDHLVFHDNVAPFLSIGLMKRFGISNPSSRFVTDCARAFTSGVYASGSTTFGDGNYGSLEALAACVVLDREATDEALYEDPSFGAIREPLLKVVQLLRSFEYNNTLPTVGLDGSPLAKSYNLRLYKMNEKIGMSPSEFQTVFAFYLPEFIPVFGAALHAQLTAPEAMLLDMPNVIAVHNGMFSLIKYGLSDCNSGFSTYPGYKGCSDNGLYERSLGHMARGPPGSNITEMVSECSLLLTAGRLSKDSSDIIMAACSPKSDPGAQYRCIQQLIVSSPEFHTTNTMQRSGEPRAMLPSTKGNSTKYKAIVQLFLAGGADSYHMLAPHTCAPINVYERFRAIRGKNSLSEGIGLTLEEMLEINGNNPEQPCTKFGIHPNLSVLRDLYNVGDAAFIANAGLMAGPVDVNTYRQNMGSVQLFAHNDMTRETQMEDIFQEHAGTGVQGRIASVLKGKGLSVNVFSISGTQVVNVGEVGGVTAYTMSSSGMSPFNSNPSITDMTNVIKNLNNATKKDSGIFAETFASMFTDAITSHEKLVTALAGVDVTTPFPSSSIAQQLKAVCSIMKSRANRGVERDLFYVSQGGYDTHSDMQANLVSNFFDLNEALSSFVTEVKAQGIWDDVTVTQYSEFSRTLDPNTGGGSDHAWAGHHFHIGGGLAGGKVRGLYPEDFEQSPSNPIALSRGRMIPTYPWDAMWAGTAEWFGIEDGPEMDYVLPMRSNFDNTYNAAELYGAL